MVVSELFEGETDVAEPLHCLFRNSFISPYSWSPVHADQQRIRCRTQTMLLAADIARLLTDQDTPALAPCLLDEADIQSQQ
jgi:hypothetical protein